MKNSLLSNLLIVLALGLCGICTYQWLREARAREVTQELYDRNYKQELEIQAHTNHIHNMDLRIAELTDSVAELKLTVKTNEAVIYDLRVERAGLISSNEFLARQLDAYTNAFADATNRLEESYENIRRQNETITNLVAQRDDFVAKLNTAVQERNEVVQQYNELVDQVKKMQETYEQAMKQIQERTKN